ncbi:MAG: hypothetical protein VW548_01180 [Methylotenera sp.]
MKNLLNVLVMCLMLSAGAVMAQEKEANIVVHIESGEYSNPIRLWHPYIDYWYFQGPMFEEVAISKLNQAYSETTMCEAAQYGKVLLWLKPKMFYNPQVQMFYGKVTANAYTGIGEHFATYEAESSVWGIFNQQTETRIRQSYAQAVDGLIEKLKADSNFQSKLDIGAASTKGASTPCSMITLLPTTRIRAMPF